MARLYANENFPFPVVQELRSLGHDVLTTDEAGTSGQAIPDEDVVAYAINDDRAVITLNRKDFIRLHAASPAHEGIVVCTFDPDFEGQAARIHDSIQATGDLAGELLRVNRPG